MRENPKTRALVLAVDTRKHLMFAERNRPMMVAMVPLVSSLLVV